MTRTFAIALFAAACGTSSAPDPTEVRSDLPRNLNPQVTASQLESVVTGNTRFTANLYREVAERDGNLFFSPHSISTALAMTYAGTAGSTATQLADALEFDLPAADLHASFNALDLELGKRESESKSTDIPFRLRIKSSMWGQDGQHFESRFLDALAVDYGAGMRVTDFRGDPEAAREKINAWVEEQTADKIQDLLPQGSVTRDTRLALANAVYFSAAWAEPFKVEDTRDRAFITPTGTAMVPTMHQVEERNYGAGEGYRAAELRYDGDKVAMVIVVPDDLAAFEAGLDAARLDGVFGSLSHHILDLSIPKFRFDAPLGLRETLQNLGMRDAFIPGTADLSGIDGTRDLYVSDVIHKGFVSIDERGTEAAAATAVLISDTAVPEPATLVVDRPFLLFVRDIPTGAILFAGRVLDPR